jgi:hypothetical protein
MKVFLVNPAWSRLGYSVITPRWLFVIAQATPRDLVGEPVLIDEAIEKFDLGAVRSGDIVGIGITTGNCQAGYDILNKAKSKGATVIMGGIHPTIFPDEPLRAADLAGRADRPSLARIGYRLPFCIRSFQYSVDI